MPAIYSSFMGDAWILCNEKNSVHGKTFRPISADFHTGGPAGAPDDLSFGVFWLGFRRNNVIS